MPLRQTFAPNYEPGYRELCLLTPVNNGGPSITNSSKSLSIGYKPGAQGINYTLYPITYTRQLLNPAFEPIRRYKYTHEDVTKIIQKNRAAGVTHNVAAERMRVTNLRDHHREQGDMDEVVR